MQLSLSPWSVTKTAGGPARLLYVFMCVLPLQPLLRHGSRKRKRREILYSVESKKNPEYFKRNIKDLNTVVVTGHHNKVFPSAAACL